MLILVIVNNCVSFNSNNCRLLLQVLYFDSVILGSHEEDTVVVFDFSVFNIIWGCVHVFLFRTRADCGRYVSVFVAVHGISCSKGISLQFVSLIGGLIFTISVV